jgi:hypothetical protein
MPAFRLGIAIAVLIFSCSIAGRCPADEPSEQETIEELRREVQELRKAVADLTKQLAQMEYQQLPQITAPAPRSANVRRPDPEPLPKYFRFPINIERGSGIPIQPRIPTPWR